MWMVVFNLVKDLGVYHTINQSYMFKIIQMRLKEFVSEKK